MISTNTSVLVLFNEKTPYNFDFCNFLTRKNYKIKAIFLKKENKYKTTSHFNQLLPQPHFEVVDAFDLKSFFKLILNKDLRGYNIVLSWGYYPYLKIFFIILRTLIFRRPCYIFADSFPAHFGYYGAWSNFARRLIIKLSNTVLITGPQALDEAKSANLPIRKFKVLPYWFDYKRVCKDAKDFHNSENLLGKNKTCPIIFCSAQLIQRKGVDVLIRALSCITHLDFLCLIEGIGPEESALREMVKLLELESKIKFIGYQAINLHYECIIKSDIICVPSLYDPWSIVVDEGMLFKKVVISTDRVGCAVARIINGINGFIVTAGDHHALSVAIMDALSSANRRNVIGMSAVRTALQHNRKFKASIDLIFHNT